MDMEVFLASLKSPWVLGKAIWALHGPKSPKQIGPLDSFGICMGWFGMTFEPH